ncbi:hypothetical protein NQ314_010398 [Rhamnusium bicolor]|uniref:Uncharacterized protein n=1 Tax=Rhamnusium bicolor TaxID=1586634 RepID=A0AAV8XS32_9CUCU|nr:hypothetical protein NQ314_010398 [Rhamnusium bicolor]
MIGGAIYIVLCCDYASIEGMKTIRLCYKLQEKFEVFSNSREELLKLAYLAKSYSPKFSAANFFVVEKNTILGIISIATTYLIVVIQFNSSLVKNE